MTSVNTFQGFVFPSGLTLDAQGNIILADRGAHRVFSIDAKTGSISTIAGTGVAGYSGDGGSPTAAALRNPEWVEFDRAGNLYLADRGNHRMRKIDAARQSITTIAGTGELGLSGDGGPANKAGLTNPFGFTLDAQGNLFVFDTEAHCIRKIEAGSGTIRTVIGSTKQGFGGDGGPAVAALLSRPHNGVFDRDGRLVFGDSFNQRIRRWDPTTGHITTIAGIGEEGTSRDGTPAAQARFTYFGAMVYNANGDLVFTSLDHRILMIDAKSGLVRVVAGTGERGAAGDGGAALRAQFDTPYGLALLPGGDLVVADAGNRRVRRIDTRTGIIRMLAGQ